MLSIQSDTERMESFDLCCEVNGYADMKVIQGSDGNSMTVCLPSTIGGESRQYFSCAHENDDTITYGRRRKRSIEGEELLSRSKRGGGAQSITLESVAIYCPQYLPNGCVSDTVCFSILVRLIIV